MQTKGYFLLGFVVGAVSGCIVSYIFYKNKGKEEQEILKDDEIDEKWDDDIADEFKRGYVPDEEVKEKLLRNWNKPPLKVSEQEAAENMHPLDSDEDDFEDYILEEDEEEPSDSPYTGSERALEASEKAVDHAKELHQAHKKNRSKSPEIVSRDFLEEAEDDFEKEEWIFWVEDGVLTDEDENIIEDPTEFIGESIDEDGFRYNNEEELIVYSYTYETIYIITKYFKAYYDTHLVTKDGINESWVRKEMNYDENEGDKT